MRVSEVGMNVNNKTAFGTVIGMCDNCRRLIYEGQTVHYYVRFQHDQYCFCDHCVTVVEPKDEERESMERNRP